MVFALQHLAKGTLADELLELEAVADLVTRDDTVVALVVIETVVDKTFELCGLVLLVGLGKVVNMIVLAYLGLLVNGQILLCRLRHGFQLGARDGELH